MPPWSPQNASFFRMGVKNKRQNVTCLICGSPYNLRFILEESLGDGSAIKVIRAWEPGRVAYQEGGDFSTTRGPGTRGIPGSASLNAPRFYGDESRRGSYTLAPYLPTQLYTEDGEGGVLIFVAIITPRWGSDANGRKRSGVLWTPKTEEGPIDDGPINFANFGRPFLFRTPPSRFPGSLVNWKIDPIKVRSQVIEIYEKKNGAICNPRTLSCCSTLPFFFDCLIKIYDFRRLLDAFLSTLSLNLPSESRLSDWDAFKECYRFTSVSVFFYG